MIEDGAVRAEGCITPVKLLAKLVPNSFLRRGFTENSSKEEIKVSGCLLCHPHNPKRIEVEMMALENVVSLR
jgi:hypothetical protein